jgi:hypothetical protein
MLGVEEGSRLPRAFRLQSGIRSHFSDCPLDQPAFLKNNSCKERVMPLKDGLILDNKPNKKSVCLLHRVSP